MEKVQKREGEYHSLYSFSRDVKWCVFVKKHLSGFVNPPGVPEFTCLNGDRIVEPKAL